MSGIISSILSVIMSLSIFGGVANMSEVTPSDAATEFIDGIAGGNRQVIESYMDNEYINFIENARDDKEKSNELEDAVFANMKYEIVDYATKGKVAVVKAKVTNSDFSGVMDSYTKESYDYVMEHLYDEDIGDKKKLSNKCLEIYVNQVEKAAKSDKEVTKEIFIPMEDDGFCGWRILTDNKIMEAMMGNLALPDKE